MQGVSYHHQIGICVAWSTLKCPPGPSFVYHSLWDSFLPRIGLISPITPISFFVSQLPKSKHQAEWQNWNNTEFVVRTPELDVFLPLFLLALRSRISKAWSHIRMCAVRAIANCKHCLVIVFPLFAVCVLAYCSNLIGPSEDYYEECSSD